MHFLKALVLSLLPIAALGATKKPAVDTFERFHTKSLASAPLKLDDSIFDKLTSAPRDYTVAVLLTALENRFGCQLCREFQPEWDLLSKSWVNGDKQGESRLLYGTLDFMDGKGTFQSVCSALSGRYANSPLTTDSSASKRHLSFSFTYPQLDLMLQQTQVP
jgi:oligosaccharyltransferase complex subunit gamma